MTTNFQKVYTELKNKSNSIYDSKSELLDLNSKILLSYLIFNYDLNILEMNHKNKDYEVCFEIRNKLINDFVKFFED